MEPTQQHWGDFIIDGGIAHTHTHTHKAPTEQWAVDQKTIMPGLRGGSHTQRTVQISKHFAGTPVKMEGLAVDSFC